MIKSGIKLFMVLIVASVIFSCSDMMAGFTSLPLGTFVIDGDSTYTFSTSVTLSINVQDAASMRFSNDGINWSNWENCAGTKAWSLQIGHGKKSVYGEFRHLNGNIMRTHDSVIPLIERKIIASDGSANDYFGGYLYGVHGSCVSISDNGKTIAVGAWNDDSAKGSVYIYKWDGNSWNETKITASGGVANDRFGMSVSLSSAGDILAVGAYWDMVGLNAAQGSAYVYRFNGVAWSESKITASDGHAGDNFGLSVAINPDGSYLAVGAYHARDILNNLTGAVYVYKWNNLSWEETKLASSNVIDGDTMGFHLAISADGNTIISGAPNHLSGTGCAFIFKYDDSLWQDTRITASDGQVGDYFGRIVSMTADGSEVLIGAYLDDVGANNDQGSVYLYKYDGSNWIENKILAPDGKGNEFFGYSVDISSDGCRFVVGANYADIGSVANQGAAYFYSWNGISWEIIKLTASDGMTGDCLGYSVAITPDGTAFVITAPSDTIGVNANQGSAYVY